MPAFDLDSWITQYCPELGSPQPWKGGRKWIFPICPFNEAHTNKSAVLIQEPSGGGGIQMPSQRLFGQRLARLA